MQLTRLVRMWRVAIFSLLLGGWRKRSRARTKAPRWSCLRVRIQVSCTEAVILVHAFLQIHAPKLAAKLASKFENLRLEQHADQAEALSNALVNTVKAAMLVPGTDVSKAFSALSEHETEAVKEVESPSKSSGTTVEHSQKQKGKKAKHEKKRKLQEDDETEEQESVLPEKEPESLAPTTPVTEVEVVEHAESRPKKKPTQGERFHRVKSDNVQFLDERLKDMSYDAKVCGGLGLLVVWRRRLGRACECGSDCDARQGIYEGEEQEKAWQLPRRCHRPRVTVCNRILTQLYQIHLRRRIGHVLCPIANASSHIPISSRVAVSQMVCRRSTCSTDGITRSAYASRNSSISCVML